MTCEESIKWLKNLYNELGQKIRNYRYKSRYGD